MKRAFKATKVTEDVYWVGAIDWSDRDFHGYLINRGTTYNTYLILSDKITLIDTVKEPFFDELLARIASVVDPEKIDYVISNHSEPDHSGSLVRMIEAVKPEKVFASPRGVDALKEYFRLTDEITPVTDGQTLSLGSE